MSDLSVKTAQESAVSPPRKAAGPSEVKAAVDSGAKASSQKQAVPDVSNYVTSPKGVVDPESGVYVLQYRDGATGEVLNQYPSEKVVDAYKRGASTTDSAPAPVEGKVSAASGNTGGDVDVSVDAPAPTTSTASVGGTTTTTGQGATTTTTSVDV